MSVTLSLTALAIVAGSTISSTALMTFLGSKSEVEAPIETECLETMFVDCDLLAKTLNEHGCCVTVVSENEIIVETSCGNLRYARNSAAEAFGLYINEVNDPSKWVKANPGLGQTVSYEDYQQEDRQASYRTRWPLLCFLWHFRYHTQPAHPAPASD